MRTEAIMMEDPMEVGQPTFFMGKNSSCATGAYHRLYPVTIYDHHSHPIDDHFTVIDHDSDVHLAAGGPNSDVHHGSH